MLPDVVRNVLHVHVFWLVHVAVAIRQRDRNFYFVDGSLSRPRRIPIGTGLIQKADRAALTSNERILIAEYCPSARSRVRVVGNGVNDTSQARRCAGSRCSTEAVTVLYTGRFVERKGIKELLDAAPRILENAPETRLVMAGGHRHSSAAEMAGYWTPPACGRFRDRIQFTGWLTPEQVNRWYAAADILVVPSWYEPFGMVILEGMLFGLGIVASDVGGPREILVDEHTGLLCTPRDPFSLERQVLRLIKDAGLRLRLGMNAARDVRSRWSYSKIVQQMRCVYAEVAGENGFARACSFGTCK